MDSRSTQILTSTIKAVLNEGLIEIKQQLDDLKKKYTRGEQEIDDQYFLRKESDDQDYVLQDEDDAKDLIDYIIKKKLNFRDKSSHLNAKVSTCTSFVALR
jgi:hypothetical protein